MYKNIPLVRRALSFYANGEHIQPNSSTAATQSHVEQGPLAKDALVALDAEMATATSSQEKIIVGWRIVTPDHPQPVVLWNANEGDAHRLAEFQKRSDVSVTTLYADAQKAMVLDEPVDEKTKEIGRLRSVLRAIAFTLDYGELRLVAREAYDESMAKGTIR